MPRLPSTIASGWIGRTVDSGIAVTLAALAILIPCAAWVFLDARERVRSGRPVVAQLASWEVSTPQQWLALCVVLLVIALPLYLVARRAS